MDKFVEFTSRDTCKAPSYSRKGLTMDYYDGNTVTAMWNYAQHYAMSDRSFSTTFGPSSPGAINLVSGQTHGVGEFTPTGEPVVPTASDYTVRVPDAQGAASPPPTTARTTSRSSTTSPQPTRTTCRRPPPPRSGTTAKPTTSTTLPTSTRSWPATT